MRTILAAAIALLVLASGVPGAWAGTTADDEELARQQDRVEKHLLRVQQERFEARARGEDEKTLHRLDKEFKRTYGRRMDVIDERKQQAQ
jgi:succinate dehydrogenase/fumarate reductase flavoprotein subunit